MVRRKPAPTTDAPLRAYLAEQARSLRETYGSADPILWRELSKPVEQLESGQPHQFRRYELPGNHPARWPEGDSSNLLILGTDDVLVTGELVDFDG